MSGYRSQAEREQAKRRREFLKSLNLHLPKQEDEFEDEIDQEGIRDAAMSGYADGLAAARQAASSGAAGTAAGTDKAGKASETSEDKEPKEWVIYTDFEPESKGMTFLRALLTTIFVLAIIGFCGFEVYTLNNTEKELRMEAERLKEEIEEEKTKVLEYQIEQVYYDSDQYKEDLARNRFRLIYPGEVMIQTN